MRKCSVPGCGSVHNLHAVPYTKSARWKIWLSICPFFSRYSFKQLEYIKICKAHFLPQHINQKNKLTSDAIPSLNLPPNPSLAFSSTIPKYLEISPSLIPDQPLEIKVVDSIATGSSDTVYTSKSVLPSLSSTATLSNDNAPILQPILNVEQFSQSLSTDPCVGNPKSLDYFHNDAINKQPGFEPPPVETLQIITSNPSDMPSKIYQEKSFVSYSNVVAPQISEQLPSFQTEPVLEPTVNIIQYSQPLSPDPNQLSINNQKSLDSFHDNQIHKHPSIDLPVEETSQRHSHNPSSTLPSTTKSFTLQGQTTPVKSSSSKRSQSYRHVMPRVCLNKNENTPRKQKLRQGNRLLQARLKSMTSKYDRLKSKLQSSKVQVFIKKYPLLSKFGKLLIDSQLRLSGVKVKALRYTNDEKIFALSLYKLSPKCYRFFQKCIKLPSKSTINSLLKDIPVRPGLNDFILQHLADVAKYKDTMGLQCVLLFDEMAIQKNLFFNFQTGVIEGFEDLGGGVRSNNVADKVLVFMLRGMFSPWKIPIAFYFARDGIKTFFLKKIIKEIIEVVSNAGFLVRLSVSDQGSANVAAINSLISDAREDHLRSSNDGSNINYYVINGKKIYHMYDVPHLLKCFRNNFQKKEIIIGSRHAQWKVIEDMYKVDGKGGAARNTRLTDKHLKPSSYDKMKVKLAAQVFSREVAHAVSMQMKTYTDILKKHDYSKLSINTDIGFFTSEIILFINDLFDSLNGSGHSKSGLKNALSLNSNHLEFWNEALKKLESMKFNAEDSRESKPLCLRNFIHDIKTIKHLWSELKSIPGVKFLSLGRLNQDPLENFFGQIRGQGGCSTHPDCHQFVGLYKTLLINDISTGKSLYANCTSDNDKMLGTLSKLINKRKTNTQPSEYSTDIQNLNFIEGCIPSENAFQTQAVSYIAGAICRYLLPKLHSAECQNCRSALLSNEIEPFHSLIEMREYDPDNKKLYYPSIQFKALIWHCIYTIEQTLPKICKVYIYTDLISKLKGLDTSWLNCVEHKSDFLNALWLFVIRMQVKQWCTNFNRRIHNVDSRKKGVEMENLIATKVTKGASYRSVRRRSN